VPSRRSALTTKECEPPPSGRPIERHHSSARRSTIWGRRSSHACPAAPNQPRTVVRRLEGIRRFIEKYPSLEDPFPELRTMFVLNGQCRGRGIIFCISRGK